MKKSFSEPIISELSENIKNFIFLELIDSLDSNKTFSDFKNRLDTSKAFSDYRSGLDPENAEKIDKALSVFEEYFESKDFVVRSTSRSGITLNSLFKRFIEKDGVDYVIKFAEETEHTRYRLNGDDGNFVMRVFSNIKDIPVPLKQMVDGVLVVNVLEGEIKGFRQLRIEKEKSYFIYQKGGTSNADIDDITLLVLDPINEIPHYDAVAGIVSKILYKKPGRSGKGGLLASLLGQAKDGIKVNAWLPVKVSDREFAFAEYGDVMRFLLGGKKEMFTIQQMDRYLNWLKPYMRILEVDVENIPGFHTTKQLFSALSSPRVIKQSINSPAIFVSFIGKLEEKMIKYGYMRKARDFITETNIVLKQEGKSIIDKSNLNEVRKAALQLIGRDMSVASDTRAMATRPLFEAGSNIEIFEKGKQLMDRIARFLDNAAEENWGIRGILESFEETEELWKNMLPKRSDIIFESVEDLVDKIVVRFYRDNIGVETVNGFRKSDMDLFREDLFNHLKAMISDPNFKAEELDLKKIDPWDVRAIIKAHSSKSTLHENAMTGLIKEILKKNLQRGTVIETEKHFIKGPKGRAMDLVKYDKNTMLLLLAVEAKKLFDKIFDIGDEMGTSMGAYFRGIDTFKDICRLITTSMTGIKSEFWAYSVRIIDDNGVKKLIIDVPIMEFEPMANTAKTTKVLKSLEDREKTFLQLTEKWTKDPVQLKKLGNGWDWLMNKINDKHKYEDPETGERVFKEEGKTIFDLMMKLIEKRASPNLEPSQDLQKEIN
ncbi:MAG: hypothetical protein ACFFD4_34600 [Candidatus Odinarchaeota archaeon]